MNGSHKNKEAWSGLKPPAVNNMREVESRGSQQTIEDLLGEAK